MHETHHPLASGLYYEDQKDAAKTRSEKFLEVRLPRFVEYFTDVLERNGGAVLVGDTVSYVDLSLFQVIEGLRYAFPIGFAHATRDVPQLAAHHDRIAQRERLAAYLVSERRIPFNEDGIFRCYPELDSA